MWRPEHQSGESLESCQCGTFHDVTDIILLWTSPEDAVTKCPKADGRVVVCFGPVVEMHVQQCDVVLYWCRDGSDQQEDRSCEEQKDANPKSQRMSVQNARHFEFAFCLTSEFC